DERLTELFCLPALRLRTAWALATDRGNQLARSDRSRKSAELRFVPPPEVRRPAMEPTEGGGLRTRARSNFGIERESGHLAWLPLGEIATEVPTDRDAWNSGSRKVQTDVMSAARSGAARLRLPWVSQRAADRLGRSFPPRPVCSLFCRSSEFLRSTEWWNRSVVGQLDRMPAR